MNTPRAWFEKDFYSTLGVGESASPEEIKRSYRRLARELHPDRNPGNRQAEERMKDVAEAYAVLSDPEKRTRYDQVRRMTRAGAGPGGFGGNVRFEDLDLGDLFGEFLGGARARRPRRGADLSANVRLAFEDAARGATVPVAVRRDAPCARCNGTGDRSGVARPCAPCAGTGSVGENQGLFAFVRTCPSCGGTGRSVGDPCPVCRGAGVETRREQVRVRVPAGIGDGARVRVRGRGAAVPGGEPGDLYVAVAVEPHPLFGRRRDDLTITVPVSFAEAALGTEVEVPTLEGPVRLRVPAGTQPGTTLRVRGRGIKRARGGGDLLVTVRVDVPRKLSVEQRALIEELAALNGRGRGARTRTRTT